MIGVTSAGVIYNFTELVISFRGKSLCSSQGCHLTHIFDTYGILTPLGLFLFLFWLLLELVLWLSNNGNLQKLAYTVLGVTLAGSLAVEGYFTGFQAWFTGKPCYFCLGVAFMVITLNAIYWFNQFNQRKSFSKSKELPAGVYVFLAPIAVFIAMALVQVPLKGLPVTQKVPIVIYQKGCSHCRELIQDAKKAGMVIKTIEAKKALSLLTQLEIKGVPVTIKKKGKTLIIGEGTETGKEILELNKMENEKTGFSPVLLPFQIQTESQSKGMCSIGSKECEK